mmetsp:Transcript_75493/g.149257  ORF Transcript_75493/g.149257 Transcript_75493/m.149257 type:complete len:250 (-) Transcript_75493:42-791(-)|eukprot:CAMPEP_0172722064 /NCGR_PEP_ID=MMETSP1074-20121228/80573_1 /TAXON_ID=2916 /ORGANISM="Ceratium fusus, Strain PA161109" /LENGTH=249 /DNA_ID=CAMNT_0013547975 /DNA_START=25 /DNA_END=774 /DNA_ORIENTATION=+
MSKKANRRSVKFIDDASALRRQDVTWRERADRAARRPGSLVLGPEGHISKWPPDPPESPRSTKSPRAPLPRLDISLEETRELGPQRDPGKAPHPSELEEWRAGLQEDVGRLMGGVRDHGSHYRGSGPAPPVSSAKVSPMARALGADPGVYPPRRADFVSFWSRDPADGFPTMPVSPARGFSLTGLDLGVHTAALEGRSQAIAKAGRNRGLARFAVPRAPNSNRSLGSMSRRIGRSPDEREAYPHHGDFV